MSSEMSRKRGVEESPINVDANKRAKASVNEASPVLHCRSMPIGVTDGEIASFFSSFGPVVRVLNIPTNHQAFVQMDSQTSADAIISTPTLTLKGRTIYVQYSNRKEITTSHSNSSMNASSSSGSSGSDGSSSLQPNRIILLSVSNLRIPVSLDHIHQICKPFGNVLRIVTFNKKEQFMALVEFPNLDSANAARHMLDGKDIFQGCCHVRATYSSLPELRVQQAGPRARDFTIPDTHAFPGVPSQPFLFPSQQQGGVSVPGGMMGQAQYSISTNPFDPNSAAAAAAAAVAAAAMHSNSAAAAAAAAMHNPASAAAVMHNHAAMHNSAAAAAAMHNHAAMHNPAAAAAAAAMHNHSHVAPQANYMSPNANEKCVLLVSNLPDNIIPEHLFTLFGVYGDVNRVKILFNKRDNALIQFANSQQALSAQHHLHHVQLFDKQLNCALSKHNEVAMPKEGDSESLLLTRDFTNSPIHRFKKSPPKQTNIHYPSQVLHVSSIPDGTTEDELHALFASIASSAIVVQFFVNNKQMAFVRMPSVGEAILALIRLHNYRLKDRYLRVSFSAKDANSMIPVSNDSNADIKVEA